MKTKKDKLSRKAKGKSAAEKAAPTVGESTPVSEDTCDHRAAASELTNHQPKSVAQEPPTPSLALVIGDTDAVLPHEVHSGKPDTEPLTAQEQLDLRRCEIVIEENRTGFLDTIAAMHEIWAKRLYRAEYHSFKQYCKKKWDFSRAYGYRLVEAHKLIQKLSTTVDSPVAITSGTQALELAKVPEHQQAEVVARAVKKAANGKLTSRHIIEAANELKGKNTAQNATSAPPPGGMPESNMVNITTPDDGCRDAKILPLDELSRMADTLHDIFLNPSRHGEAGELLLQLKEQLRLYAEWEAQDLGEAQLKQPA